MGFWSIAEKVLTLGLRLIPERKKKPPPPQPPQPGWSKQDVDIALKAAQNAGKEKKP